MKLALPRILVALLPLVAAACDSLATSAFRPPYFTIDGRIVMGAPALPPSDVHVAILWFDDRSTHTNFAEQIVDVQPGVADFKISIADLPPASVLHDVPLDKAQAFGLDPQLRWAYGTIVAYLDAEPDGRLDIGATLGESGDRIVGAASDIDVFYLAAGQPAPPSLVGIFPTAPGFSLVREPPPPSLPAPGQCGHFDEHGHFSDLCEPIAPVPTPLGAGEAITLTLAGDADQRWACASFWGPLAYPDWSRATPDQICDGGVCPYCRGYQCPLDLPAAGDPCLSAADDTSYVYSHCEPDATACGTTFCHFGHGERLAGDPAPAGWPSCPHQP